MKYLIGYDIGSSSVKGALVEAATGRLVAASHFPDTEMPIHAPQMGFAEQDPDYWWHCVQQVTQRLLHQTQADPAEVGAIGLSYQMHGLVLVDKAGQSLRPSIIWCDSRAVPYGAAAQTALGTEFCLQHYLNAPGNFTASKAKWVRENQPAIFEQAHKMMLPGDYIAFKMSGEMQTTVTGLSEGILYDFKAKGLAHHLMDAYGLPATLIPDIVPAVGYQSRLSEAGAAALGLKAGTLIGYRAGDQPNNALSLGVLHGGQVAATGGTSGVIYAVADAPVFDPQSRVNSFAHVNYTAETPYTGVLLCINGAGSQYRWMRHTVAGTETAYADMEQQAAQVAPGSDGLLILPYGNGAERMLGNQNPGGSIHGLDFNIHGKGHLYRAALEGIAYAFYYGAQILQSNGIALNVLKVGSGNLFESPLFSTTLATLLGCTIEVYDTNGAAGAARAAGVAAGAFATLEEAVQNQREVATFGPVPEMDRVVAGWERVRGLLD